MSHFKDSEESDEQGLLSEHSIESGLGLKMASRRDSPSYLHSFTSYWNAKRLAIALTTVIICGVLTSIAFIWRSGSSTLHLDKPCGSTADEAMALGCKFDIINYSWQPAECFDEEVHNRYWEKSQKHGPLKWYADSNFTTELPQDVQLLMRTPMIALVAIFAAQLALLVPRIRNSLVRTDASLVADILSLLATIGAICLSHLDHQRSLRPSSLLSLYLSLTLILSVARTRTFWLISSAVQESAASTAVLSFTTLALLLESVEKKSILSLDARHGAPEQYSGFWSRTVFAWLAATFRAGYSKIITVEDLPALDSQLQTQRLRQKLFATWSKYDRSGKNSLLLACFRAFARSLLSGVLPRLCLTVFTFTQPFLINTTVDYVGQANANANYGNGLIGAWALVFIGIAVSGAVYRYQSTRFTSRIRGSLVGLIYQQTVAVRTFDAGDITAVSLLGADIERISFSFNFIHESWGALVDIGVAIWLLERQISVAAVVPVIISIVFMGIISKLSGASKDSQMHWIQQVQARLKVTSSILGDVKSVKMMGLTGIVSGIIAKLRQVEITASKRYRRFLVLQLFLSNIPINLAPALTFAVYAIIAIYWKNSTLLTSQAFTSITLIQLLTKPVLMYIQIIPGLVQCIGLFGRIQTYCNYCYNAANSGKQQLVIDDESPDICLEPLPPNIVGNPGSKREQYAIILDGHDFTWKREQNATLKDVSLKIEHGKVVMLIGPVASGKSTLLEGILGEVLSSSSSSSVLRDHSPTAYCAQQPWLENDTIRANILGVSSYDRTWYSQVKALCGLDEDFKMMAKGDRTKIGSKGLSISGGQKQRIALARAIYSKSQLILLDDVFSGMDAQTAASIASQLLGPEGYFRRNSITVVMATHNQKLMPFADMLIVLENGKVSETGSPIDLMQGAGYTNRLGLNLDDGCGSHETHEFTNIELEKVTSTSSVEVEDHGDRRNDDLRRKNGDASVYKYYVSSAGYWITVMFFVSIMAWVFFTEFPAIWLRWWSEANTTKANNNVGMYIGVLAALGIAGVISVSIACWLGFIQIITNTALKMHSDLLDTTLNAPLHFFVSTGTGDLTNRFSQDMELIDMNLPMVMSDYVLATFTLIAKGIILFVFSKYLAIAVPFIGGAVFFLQNFYLYTSRQVRLLEIEGKAPLYTHFIETVSGAPTIRAFGWQRQHQARNDRLVDTSQKSVYLQQCIQHWLTTVLNLLVCGVAVLLVGIIVGWREKFSAGNVGVSLVMVVTFSEVLARVIVMWTRMESSIGAVTRVLRFVNDTECEEEDTYKKEIPSLWPQAGQIEFHGVVASHTPDAGPVLKGISFSIAPREHVAICGRSGSGKTSLILTLLKMMHKQAGSIVVDGINIADLSCNDVRLSFSVIPQDPFFLPGSVRMNVDPFGVASDAEIIHVLGTVKLWQFVQEQGGLDKDLDSKTWSAGQQQLLCLARALMRKSKILILDEATSSVDSETESLMQEIIDTSFQDCTVLAVMHRLSHIKRYDKVAHLANGVLLEYDSPTTLLAGSTQFADLYRVGHTDQEGQP